VSLERGFAIAHIPVTNAEFNRFLLAGGYDERRWWAEAGWLFIGSGGAAIRQPAHWGAPEYGAPAQPVVGLSWYEAAAYCAWLSEAGRRAGWLREGEALRLPTAIEWERAARHTDKRRYPWGDQPPTDAHAAHAALGMPGPAPVGAFPAGAAVCGARDMAGNIWEWTSSLAEGSESPAPCEDVSAGETPLIKGGSFSSGPEELRCGAASWRHPGHRSAGLGFRLVRAVSLPS
jgi:formylglycine-generating enzyme required for sulfatase activity